MVEDDPAIRTAVAEALEDMGYVVETASNGVEALAKVREDDFAAIVLDLMMPVMTGPAGSSWMRAATTCWPSRSRWRSSRRPMRLGPWPAGRR